MDVGDAAGQLKGSLRSTYGMDPTRSGAAGPPCSEGTTATPVQPTSVTARLQGLESEAQMGRQGSQGHQLMGGVAALE